MGSLEARFPTSARTAEPQIGLSDQLAALAAKIECRRADSLEDREAIFRLRYNAYLREGAIAANPSQRFADPFDDIGNVHTFGLYIDGVLASSLRLHIGSRDNAAFPSLEVFPDILQPEIDVGRVVVDATRFVADERMARLHRGLPYVTLRLCMLAAERFGADFLLAAIRAEHRAFYQRAFNHRTVCAPRPYPHLAKPISLMTLHFPTAAANLYRRYPFFHSTALERQRLFGRDITAENVCEPRTDEFAVGWCTPLLNPLVPALPDVQAATTFSGSFANCPTR